MIQVGRLVNAIEKLGELDNTLLFYIIGDNGASAEGGLVGTLNETMALNGLGAVDLVARQLKQLEDFGGSRAFNHFAVG